MGFIKVKAGVNCIYTGRGERIVLLILRYPIPFLYHIYCNVIYSPKNVIFFKRDPRRKIYIYVTLCTCDHSLPVYACTHILRI